MKCKHGREGCGQYFDCGKCTTEANARAYQRLTPQEKAYDRYVDPIGAYHYDFPAGCSCHINAPCSTCVQGDDEEEA